MNPVSRNPASIEQCQVDIPSASSSHTLSARAVPLNLPCQDLLDEGRREEYVKICLPLYKASRKGDWKAAKGILDEHKELVRFSITKNCETALHVAVSRRKTEFVKNLLSLMEKEDVELQDNSSYTALHVAVRAEKENNTLFERYNFVGPIRKLLRKDKARLERYSNVEMARILLKKNKALIDIPTSLGMMPLQMAASYKNSIFDADMLEFLYEHSRMEGDFWTPENRSCFLLTCVEAEYFDVALKVLEDRPEQLALSGGGVLKLLAQKTNAFKRFPEKFPALPLLRSMLKNIAKLPWPEVYDLMRGPADPIDKEKTATNRIDTPKKYSSRVLFLASEVANIVFIVEIIRQYPELLNDVNDVNQTIFHVAISHRHMELYSLLKEMGSIKDHIVTLEDENGNNMLHLAGIFTESAKSKRYSPEPPGQLNEELLWFEEVENMLPTYLREKKNAAGMTPREEFIKNHKDLYSDFKKYIKDASSQLIVVAALLATISFAATITFPGGYSQDTGYPFLSRNKLFPPFIIFNSTAFLSASTSMIASISLVTTTNKVEGRYMVNLLRRRLTGALFTLLISIVATIIAFMFNLFLLFEKSLPMLPKLSIGIITLLLCVLSHHILGMSVDINLQRVWKLKSHGAPYWMPSTRSDEQVLFQNV